jgi:hypothetical protein
LHPDSLGPLPEGVGECHCVTAEHVARAFGRKHGGDLFHGGDPGDGVPRIREQGGQPLSGDWLPPNGCPGSRLVHRLAPGHDPGLDRGLTAEGERFEVKIEDGGSRTPRKGRNYLLGSVPGLSAVLNTRNAWVLGLQRPNWT